MMKRIVCLIAALVLTLSISLACAEGLRSYTKEDGYVYVNLGKYPQKADGTELPLLWRVLTVDEEKAYLCSEYVLFAMPMHVNYTEYKTLGKDFGQTELCKYLNGDFASVNFTTGQLFLLAEDETYGKFFLLSGDELKNKAYGFTSNESRKAWGTEYALNNGLFKYMSHRGSHSPYWTRTQSTSNVKAARCTKSQGELGYITVTTDDEGMRPACWLRLEQIRIDSGSGTMEDPFTLLPVPGADEPVVIEVTPLE